MGGHRCLAGVSPVPRRPAHRPITLRDLLTMRLGIGLILAPPDQYPIQRAMAAADLAPAAEPADGVPR